MRTHALLVRVYVLYYAREHCAIGFKAVVSIIGWSICMTVVCLRTCHQPCWRGGDWVWSLLGARVRVYG